mgnify:CR=1 FL=1
MEDDYKFIDWWGKRLDSQPYYIKYQKELARVEKAPQSSVYRTADGRWVTIHDITADSALAQLKRIFGNDVLETNP